MHRSLAAAVLLLLIAGCLSLPAPATRSSPEVAAGGRYRDMARAAGGDLIRHFWVGDAATGHILDTYGGRGENLPRGAERGVLWERSTFITVLMDLYQATGDGQYRRMLAADWAVTRSRFRPDELQTTGPGSESPAHDDAGWDALMYLNHYRVLRDPEALDRAKGIVLDAWRTFWDPRCGLAYHRGEDSTSSTQGALILAAIRLYEITRDRGFWDRAMQAYEWTEAHLLRPDGLYWWWYEKGAPRRLGVIREALSDSHLGANMAMAVVHSRLYRDTGRDVYQDRAVRTADAITAHETDAKGAFLDDRDAWCDGTFMGDYAREVLTLPRIGEGHRTVLRRTADGVCARARTSTGFYGACWNGPAEGDGCAWNRTLEARGGGSGGLQSLPDQVMTSCNAVEAIAGAAVLEAGGRPWPAPVRPPAP